jgi:hypothetical protein
MLITTNTKYPDAMADVDADEFIDLSGIPDDSIDEPGDEWVVEPVVVEVADPTIL